VEAAKTDVFHASGQHEEIVIFLDNINGRQAVQWRKTESPARARKTVL